TGSSKSRPRAIETLGPSPTSDEPIGSDTRSMRPGGNDSGGGSRAGRGSAHALVIPAGDTSDGGFPSALTRGRGRRATASSAAVVLLADRGVAFGPPLGRSHSGGPRLITCQPRFARWGGRPPIPPECRRTGVVGGSRPCENQDRARIASAPAASSGFRL